MHQTANRRTRRFACRLDSICWFCAPSEHQHHMNIVIFVVLGLYPAQLWYRLQEMVQARLWRHRCWTANEVQLFWLEAPQHITQQILPVYVGPPLSGVPSPRIEYIQKDYYYYFPLLLALVRCIFNTLQKYRGRKTKWTLQNITNTLFIQFNYQMILVLFHE